MLLDIRHETTLQYASPVNYSIQQLRLTPREDSTQRPLNWRVSYHVHPTPDPPGRATDPRSASPGGSSGSGPGWRGS